ncbi:MAG: HNH endonuclease [Acidimicrobiales bacterium]
MVALRRAVKRRGRFTCRSCGRLLPAASLEVDHRAPLVPGGGGGRNLVLLCKTCHAGKTHG